MRWRIYPYNLHFRHANNDYEGAKQKAHTLCARYSYAIKGAALQHLEPNKGWSPLSLSEPKIEAQIRSFGSIDAETVINQRRQAYMKRISL